MGKSFKKKNLFALVFAILAFVTVMTSNVNVANAGYVPGGGIGTGSGAEAQRLAWNIMDKTYNRFQEVMERPGSKYNDVTKESIASYIRRMKGKNASYTQKIRLIAFVGIKPGIIHSDVCNNWPYKLYCNKTDKKPELHIWSGISWTNQNNWRPSNGFSSAIKWSNFPSELRDPSKTGMTPYTVGNQGIVLMSGGRPVSAVWIDPDLEAVTKTTVETRTKITHTEGGEHDIDYPSGNTSQLKKIFDEAPTEGSYHWKTPPNATTDTHTVKSKILTVVKKTTWKEYPGGRKENVVTTYTSQNPKSFTKTINYNVNVPTITPEKYCPWNLNRNNYATTEDIDGSYANSDKKIDATVDNKQNVTNNSYLKSLDINQDLPFIFKFNNNTMGMNSSYNWNNTPSALANGTYENVTGSYANGRNDHADSDGNLRYDLNFYASISNNTTNPSVNSSSLLYGSEEKTANEFYKKTQGFTGGDFDTRFTYADKYTTDNNQSGSHFPQWWIAKYKESKFYEYGTEYWGKITISGIENPHTISHGTGAVDGSNYKITTDANAKQRGLYVGRVDSNIEQPILYGKWDVATVAGDLH